MADVQVTGEQQALLMPTHARGTTERLSVVHQEHRPLRHELPIGGDDFDGGNGDPFVVNF